MQISKVFRVALIGVVLSSGAVVYAKPSALYQPDLIKEAHESRVMAEGVVQTSRPEPRRSYVIQAGSFQGERASLAGSLYRGEYDISSPSPYLSFGYHHYFIGQREWAGVLADFGYSTAKSADGNLYLFSMPASLAFAVRSRVWEKAQLRTTAAAGVSAILFFQRGLEGANTSVVKQVPMVQVGLEWCVGRILSPQSLVPMTAFLNWRRWIDSSPGEINFEAQAISAGLGVNL